jgi:hypothetical protein
MSATNAAQPKPQPKPPAILVQMDLNLRAVLKAKNAPPKVLDAWDNFFKVACEWAAEMGNNF